MAKVRASVPFKEIIPSIISFGRRFWPQLRHQWGLITLSFVALFVAIVARVLEPWPLKYIFDFIIAPSQDNKSTAILYSFVDASTIEDSQSLLILLVAAVIVFAASRALATYLATVGMALIATRVASEIRAMLFSHLQKLSLAFHHNTRSGDLITRFTYDIDRLRDVAALALLPLVANLLTVIAMVALMFWFSAELALIILAVVPFFYLSSIRFSGRIQKVVREQRARDGAMAATAAESIGAIKVVQALSLNKILEKTFKKQNSKSLKKGAQAQRLSARLERNIEIMLAVATALVLWRGASLVLDASITAGTLLVFMAYLGQVFRPMRQTAKYLVKISKALASGERVAEILDTLPEITERKDAKHLERAEGCIQFNQVSFKYNKHLVALHDFNLSINPGEKVALVGPSGAGKSTVLSLLLRLYDPRRGEILLDGLDLRDYTLESLRHQSSIVLQDSVLFAVSIRDNISYGKLDATDDAIEAAARLANAHDFIAQLPEGYDTVIGERGATLSGGQRQRIALARAVVRNAPIMILDEPTTGLDRTSEQEVVEALTQCTTGKTTLLVSHDLSAAQAFDTIYYIDHGRVLESGTHQQLLDTRGAYWTLYTQQAKQLGMPTSKDESLVSILRA